MVRRLHGTRPVRSPYSTHTRPVLDPHSTRTRPVLDPQMAEAYLGFPLFPTRGCDDIGHLGLMMQILGPMPPSFPHAMLSQPHTAKAVYGGRRLEDLIFEPDLLQFLRTLLAYEPALRPTADQALRLPFLASAHDE